MIMRYIRIPKSFVYAALCACLLVAAVALHAEESHNRGTRFTPSARGGYLLPSGYLSTRGNQIVDEDGIQVRIASIGWDGPEGPAGFAPQGLWATSYKTILLSIKQDGFNTVRIPWSNVNLDVVPLNRPETGTIDYTQNTDLQGLTMMQIFEKMVDYAGDLGLKVIFDHHTDDGSGGQQPNGLWIDKGPGTDNTDDGGVVGTVDAAKFQADWLYVAKTFAGNPTVIGFDLDNEPTEASAHWGGGGPTDIQMMYETVGNAIQAIDPGALIIVEGPIEWGSLFGGDLRGVAALPVRLNKANKLVYSVHEYPSEIGGEPFDSGQAYIDNMNTRWGYIERQHIAPVWIGELGSNMLSDDSKAWAGTLLPYLGGRDGLLGGPTFTGCQQPVSTSYWNVGWEDPSGNPDATQYAWGLGNYKPEQQAVTDQLLFKPRLDRHEVRSESGVAGSGNDRVDHEGCDRFFSKGEASAEPSENR